jgi:hypothetical protein
MSTRWLSRRRFLTVSVGLCATRWAEVWAEVAARRTRYTLDIGILYGVFNFRLTGGIEEHVDRGAGEYEVTLVGQGPKMANRMECHGRLHDGRWAPVRTKATFDVAGRGSLLDVAYDWDRRMIDYRMRAETFFLRRRRAVDDRVAIPPGQHVDDAVSAILNHADGRWPAGPDGKFHTSVIRRRRSDSEGPDDVAASYRAELVPCVVSVTTEASGVTTAHVDMTRFSSWARREQPARIVLSPDGRPSVIASSLILGSSIAIHFANA